MCLVLRGFLTMAPLRCAAKFDPSLSLDRARVEGVGAILLSGNTDLCHPEAAASDAALADVAPVDAEVLLVQVLADLAKVHPVLLLPQLSHGVALLLLADPASSDWGKVSDYLYHNIHYVQVYI